MGDRGPEPENTMRVIDARPKERPKPFVKMSGAAKVDWRRIVDDLPSGFYEQHELGQLRAYCEAEALNARAISEMIKKDAGVVVTGFQGMPATSQWFKVFKETSAVMASLGTKLRINKNAKLTNESANRKMTGERAHSK